MWKKFWVTLIRTSQNSAAQSYFPNILSGMQSYTTVLLFITLCQSPFPLPWLQVHIDQVQGGDGHSYPLCSALCLKLQQLLAPWPSMPLTTFLPSLSFCPPCPLCPLSFFFCPSISPHSRGKRNFHGLFAAFLCASSLGFGTTRLDVDYPQCSWWHLVSFRWFSDNICSHNVN